MSRARSGCRRLDIRLAQSHRRATIRGDNRSPSSWPGNSSSKSPSVVYEPNDFSASGRQICVAFVELLGLGIFAGEEQFTNLRQCRQGRRDCRCPPASRATGCPRSVAVARGRAAEDHRAEPPIADRQRFDPFRRGLLVPKFELRAHSRRPHIQSPRAAHNKSARQVAALITSSFRAKLTCAARVRASFSTRHFTNQFLATMVAGG